MTGSVQGRLRGDKKTYAFFLDIQRAYDTVWLRGDKKTYAFFLDIQRAYDTVWLRGDKKTYAFFLDIQRAYDTVWLRGDKKTYAFFLDIQRAYDTVWLRGDKKTYAFFLDIQRAYDTGWCNILWYKLWDMAVKGRMWRVIKKMYESSTSTVVLEGEKLDSFNAKQGVAQGCSLSILFSIFIKDLYKYYI